MPAADFPDNWSGRWQERRQFRTQRETALGNSGKEFRFVTHVAFWGGRRRTCKPEASGRGKSRKEGGLGPNIARQAHEDRGALTHFAFSPYPSAVELNNMFHDTQAKTGATGLA